MPITSSALLRAALLLGLSACTIEQRPPAGPAREQAAVQGAVAAYYAGTGKATGVPVDPAFAGDSIVVIRTDIQVQRDLASVFATIRVRIPGHGPQSRFQHLLLRRSGSAWTVAQVFTDTP